MSELRTIVEAARALRNAGDAFVTATVVRVQGSSYRRPGARMLATRDRWVTGSISGGCLEREVLQRGFWRTRDRGAVLVRHDEAEDADTGTGCQGVVDVLLEHTSTSDACDVFAFAERCLETETPGAIVTVFRSDRDDVPVGARVTVTGDEVEATLRDPGLRALFLAEARALLRSGAAAYVTQHSAQGTVVEALVEPMLPPPHLFLFGTAHDATPVITLAKNLDWSVSVWDGQPRISARERLLAADHYLTGPLSDALTSLERCARPVAVVMGHHYEQDRAVLAGLLRGRASYIGVLGPRRRTDRMLAESGMRVSEAMLERVYAPVGLQLGAETPAEIALAILAEAQAVLTRSHAQGLRLHAAAIHPRDATTHAWGELAVSAE